MHRFVAALPDPVLALTGDERDLRCVIGDDNCALDDRRFFLRGDLLLLLLEPVPTAAAPFVWTVWVELDRPRYKRALALWGNARRTDEPPYDVALATRLPPYPDTNALPATLHLGAPGARPRVVVPATGGAADHPLAREQRDGISAARAEALAAAMATGRPAPRT